MKPEKYHVWQEDINNMSGILMRTLQPSEDGSTPASLDGLPAGTYIIKNGKTNYKIIKK